VQEVTRYIAEYDGGDCFYVTPVAVTANSAAIDAFGASPGPFQAFDEAFLRAVGFEAQIGLRKVNTAQCPVVSFVSRVNDQGGQAPRLQIKEDTLRSGQFLSGSVDNFGQRHVDLLLVSDDGAVHNLAVATKRVGTLLTFNLKIENTRRTPGAKPQVLVALATERPLPLLASRTPLSADKLFPMILEEATRTGQTIGASVKYFRLDG
jgi:eukaryotic-like serine/threonine-protein kinase